MRIRHILLFCLASVSSFGQSAQTLLYNVNVVDVETGKIRNRAAVLIKDGTISQIGDSDALRRNTPKKDQIDGQDKFLIPGLWDMHVHLEGADLVEDNKLLLPVFLAYGITTVRDCASDLGEQVLAWRNEIASNKLVGPTIYTAGRKLEGKNSIWKGDLEIGNEAELKEMLDLLDRYKVDFVKITENALGGELFLTSVKQAHARGYRVSGHVPLDVSIDALADAGYTSVEHAGYLLRLGNDEASITKMLTAGTMTRAEASSRYATGFNQEQAMQGYKRLAGKGVFICPTLIGGRQLAYLSETDHSKDEFLNYLTEKFVSNYQWRIQRMAGDTKEQQAKRKEDYQFLVKQIPQFHKAGLTIIAGSDAAALNTYVYPAESLLQELEIFQEAGLTPFQILRTATMNGPKYFRVADKVGTISAGKKADLVLLDSNPLTNVQALRKVNSVVVAGKYYSRADLDAFLSKAREEKKRLDSQRR